MRSCSARLRRWLQSGACDEAELICSIFLVIHQHNCLFELSRFAALVARVSTLPSKISLILRCSTESHRTDALRQSAA